MYLGVHSGSFFSEFGRRVRGEEKPFPVVGFRRRLSLSKCNRTRLDSSLVQQDTCW